MTFFGVMDRLFDLFDSCHLSIKFFNARAMDFAASKPIHTAAMPSALSEDARQQNYRGFFNLGVIILAVSNFKLIAENLTL